MIGAYQPARRGSSVLMAPGGVDKASERPFDELVQNASKEAVGLAQEQLDLARLELLARARRAAPGLGLIGGGACLAVLASGTGTASLVLLLSRRPGASAAAFGVTAAYAGAGAVLAREGLARLQGVGSPFSEAADDDKPAKRGKNVGEAAQRRTQSATKSVKQRVKSPTTSSARSKARAKSPASSRRTTGAKSARQRKS
jgi:hypothetical protein